MRLNLFPYLFACFFIVLSCTKETNNSDEAILYLTSLDKKSLLEKQEINAHTIDTSLIDKVIKVTDSVQYQIMDGFGYTLTGGSAMLIHKMSKSARSGLLNELFSKEGLGVSYLRLSIGASDLDSAPFSYNDLPKGKTDVDLEKFSLAQDTVHLVPVLKEILSINPQIKFLGSPWSPPVWMKDNQDTRGGSLLPEYYQVYANYLIKYIQAMRGEGIEIDAITIQNEPLHPGNNPSLLMKAPQQADFIKNHLGPAFKNEGIDTKIIIYDHNADRPDYPINILNDPDAAKFIDGSAFHLYGGEIEALSEVHQAHPDKHLYFTEQWVGAPGDFSKELTWHIENLIIGAPRNWSKTVLEWNLAADQNQNPHTDRGGCDRCLGAVTINGDKVTREPAYYIIGQASKFVPPGSVRIASTLVEEIPNVSYKTPDGQIVTILQNTSEEEKEILIKSDQANIHLKLAAGDIGTLVF
ncbi:glycoside hydrolase family 30 protein [Leeuwenhoekiella palythoae]|uniref:Glucosylceramidase n=1 Tax=Leeuwenhoekiella palythoae TaxID=573501 RepID=A0A1M5WSJ8_9FLAO|nr:glycoside hydrolase family 30 beta sandwich domain-containing protein [Leeuwenhoekiella palythoae]RXG31485.1 glucosylceramidase [Leeuwenhoekiella palythoae]SHH90003.1 glucosylceramidase [Leeuwenhoekiella palythoae]